MAIRVCFMVVLMTSLLSCCLAQPQQQQQQQLALPELNALNFKQATQNARLTFVLFSKKDVSECNACQRADMNLKRAFQEFGRLATTGVVYSDTLAGKKLMAQFGVESMQVPFAMLYHEGMLRPYRAPFSPQYIVESVVSVFVAGKSKTIDSKLTKADFMKNYQNVARVVGCFASDKTPEAKAFLDAASFVSPTAIFGFSVDCKLMRSLKVKKQNQVIMLKPQQGQLEYKGKFNMKDISDWVLANKKLVVDEMLGEHFTEIQDDMDKDVRYMFLFLDSKSGQYQRDVNDFRRAALAVEKAKKHSGIQKRFFIVDSKRFRGFADRMLGSHGGSLPQLFIAQNLASNDGKEFQYDKKSRGKLSMRSMKKFMLEYLEGKVETFLKSAPEPESNDGPVKIVTANSFDSMVMDNDKSVLVEFWATWCGHCRRFEPVYEEIGQHFANNESIVIAKYESGDNAMRKEWGVTGFPTLLLFRAGEKDTPVKFQGDRSKEEVVKFVEEGVSEE